MQVSSKTLTLALLTGIFLVGTFLRFYRLDTYSIFFDEKSTMVVSQGIVLEGANQKDVFGKPSFTPADFWKPKSVADYYEAMTRSDIGNSPFYYLLLHGWMDIFGLSDFSARAFSAVFGVLIMMLTFVFARRFFSERTALIAAGLMAIEPFFIAYSHQARNYTLTFFLALASTYFLLRIVENENAGRRSGRDYLCYLGYIVSSFLCPLSHFLTVSVFMAQGVYVLFFLKISRWPYMAVAVTIAMTGIFWWLRYGGGAGENGTLFTLDYQAKEYRRVAETMPYDNPYGVVLLATPANVFFKSLPIFSDLLLFTNGLVDVLEGKKNLLLSIFSGLGMIALYYLPAFRRLSFIARASLLLFVVCGPMVLYSQTRLQFAILSVGIFLLSLAPSLHRANPAHQRPRLWLLYIMATIPTLFLIIMAFRNGHTFGLTQRYSGFSFPFVIIWVSLLAQYVWRIRPEFRMAAGVAMLLQLGFVSTRLLEIYEDRSPKYGYFSEPRTRNPYYEAASQIKKLYQPGDTIFYGAPRMVPFNEMGRTFLDYSIQDAQLTNLYLPKNAAYVQVMDTVRVNQITLRKGATGKELVLADLKNRRH